MCLPRMFLTRSRVSCAPSTLRHFRETKKHHRHDSFDHVDELDYPLPDQVLLTEDVQYVESAEPFKTWICVYPVYLDADKSISGGRRVAKEYAHPDPYPRAIVESVRKLKLPVFVEPNKIHPKSFHGNTMGRVRVQLKGQDGRLLRPDIPNKHRLLIEIGRNLRELQPGMDPPKMVVPPQYQAMLQQPVDLFSSSLPNPEMLPKKPKRIVIK